MKSKFIINRNNLELLYVVRMQILKRTIFLVYENNHVTALYPDAFYDTYGNDEILSISAAIPMIERALVTKIDANRIRPLLFSLRNIEASCLKSNKNPQIGKDKKRFLQSLSIYNVLTNNEEDDISINIFDEEATDDYNYNYTYNDDDMILNMINNNKTQSIIDYGQEVY